MELENTDDVFSKAFEDLSKLGEEAIDKPAEPAPAAEAPAVEPDPAAEQGEPVVEPAAGAAPADGEQPHTPEPEAEEKPVEAQREDVLKRFADLLDRQQKAQEQAQEPPAQQPVQEEAPALFSPEEVEQLQAFEKDWPDVAQSVRTIMRANQQVMAQHVFQEVGRFLRPHLEMLDTIAGRLQYSELTQAVPNYDDLRDRVVDWALSENQPKYLREAYKNVIEHGDLDEIKDLIQRYEASTGQSAKPAKSVQTQKAPELPPAAKQAAKSLAPVSGKRSAPSVQEDPTDFDSAFSRFVSEIE